MSEWINVNGVIFIFQEMAFRRVSFERATKWSEHKNDVMIVNASSIPNVDTAYIGLGVVLAMGAAYLFKKLKR